MGRCRLGHTKTFRVQQGKGRQGARAGLARGLWLLLIIVLATPGADPPSVSAGEAPAAAGGLPALPAAAGVTPTIPADEVPATAGVTPTNLAGGVPAAAGVTLAIPAGEVPSAATDDPPSLATSSGGAAIRDPFRPVRIPPSESPARENHRPGVHPPSSPFSLRRGSGQGTLSLHADDAPVRQVLQALAAQRGMNLVVTPGVEGEITLRLQEMPWRQALALVLTAGGLQMTRQGQTLVVSQQEAQDEQQQEKAASTASREGGRR